MKSSRGAGETPVCERRSAQRGASCAIASFVAERASDDKASVPGFPRRIGCERHDERERQSAASQRTKSAASNGHSDAVFAVPRHFVTSIKGGGDAR